MRPWHQSVVLVAFCLALACANAQGPSLGGQGGDVPEPVGVEPVLDVPLRSPAVCRGPDGAYYMTGTAAADGSDFAVNDGVWLWKSAGLRTWEEVGQVWSIRRQGAAWQQQHRPLRHENRRPGEPTRMVRGMTSPEIHFIRDTFWIPYSMNGWGCGLLKSTTGKPEGPYEDLGPITPAGATPSLFEDDDGSVYWVMDEGWIAKMTDDMTGLADSPQLVMPRSSSDLGHSPFAVGRTGAFLFKRDNTYCLAVAEWTSRTGSPVYDSFVATAESLDGPWDCRHLMGAHSGETTVFKDPDGRWLYTMSSPGTRARFRDRPALVPLEWVGYELYWSRGVRREFPTKPMHVIAERGAWDRCRPLTDYHMRDIHVLVHDDGYIYFTGSTTDNRLVEKIVLWRFKADDAALVGRGRGEVEMQVIGTHADIHWLDLETRLKHGKRPNGSYGLMRQSMDTKVYFVGGTFYVTFNLYGGAEFNKHREEAAEGKSLAGPAVFRSTSGTWDGPWESVGKGPYSHLKLYEDEQGRIYTQRGWRGVMELQEDGSFKVTKQVEELPEIQLPAQGMSYVDDGTARGGTAYLTALGAWCWVNGEWNGAASLDIEGRPGSTYDKSFSWSESGDEVGPYPAAASTLPHCSGAAQFRDGKGRWWSTLFGNDSTSPWFCRMGLVPLTMRKEGNQYLFDIADEWPEN